MIVFGWWFWRWLFCCVGGFVALVICFAGGFVALVVLLHGCFSYIVVLVVVLRW